MRTAKEITQFVEEVCSHYSIYLGAFMPDYFPDDGPIQPEHLFENGVVDQETLHKLSTILGMQEKDVSETNYEAALAISKKYPFFRLLRKYEEAKAFSEYKCCENGTYFDETKQLIAIFGDECLKKKYTDEEVLNRLIAQLKEFDAIIPGTYHPCGQIMDLHHEEECFIDFPQYSLMMESFLAIYDRMTSLFFKAFKEDLSSEEIQEYNLFISYFRAREWASTRVFLHYENLLKYRNLFISEKYHDFDSYVKINRLTTNFEPWKCKQFVDNKEYAQRYMDIYPGSKDRMFHFFMYIKHIFCIFKWSDAPYIEDEDDLFFPEELQLGKHQEWTRIYIPKTKEEIGDDEKNADLLREFASPETKGGLTTKKPELPVWDTQLLLKRSSLRKAEGLT